MFITEGNPIAEPQFSYMLSSYAADTLVSADQSVPLCRSPLSRLSICFFLSPGAGKHVFAAHTEVHVTHDDHPICPH